MANRQTMHMLAALAGRANIWFLADMKPEDDKLAESKRILRRVHREADGAPFGGPDGPGPEDDPLDRLGTKIGRGLGILVTIFLLLAFIVWFGAALPT